MLFFSRKTFQRINIKNFDNKDENDQLYGYLAIVFFWSLWRRVLNQYMFMGFFFQAVANLMQKMLLDFLYDFFETKEEDMDLVRITPENTCACQILCCFKF